MRSYAVTLFPHLQNMSFGSTHYGQVMPVGLTTQDAGHLPCRPPEIDVEGRQQRLMWEIFVDLYELPPKSVHKWKSALYTSTVDALLTFSILFILSLLLPVHAGFCITNMNPPIPTSFTSPMCPSEGESVVHSNEAIMLRAQITGTIS